MSEGYPTAAFNEGEPECSLKHDALMSSIHFTSLYLNKYLEDTCSKARPVNAVEPLRRARHPNQGKVDEARPNLRAGGRRTEVDVEPKTLLVRI